MSQITPQPTLGKIRDINFHRRGYRHGIRRSLVGGSIAWVPSSHYIPHHQSVPNFTSSAPAPKPQSHKHMSGRGLGTAQPENKEEGKREKKDCKEDEQSTLQDELLRELDEELEPYKYIPMYYSDDEEKGYWDEHSNHSD